MITGQQIIAARNALRWSANELAGKAGIAAKTVRRIEANDGLPNSTIATLDKLKRVFEAAGVEFIGTPDDGPGIRIYPKTTKG